MTHVIDRRRSVLPRAIGWTTASTLASAAINYAYTLVLAYALVPASFTVFAAGQALLLVMGTMSSAAAPWLLAYEIARRPGDRAARQQAVSFAMLLDLVLGTLSGFVVALIALSFASAGVCLLLGLATVVIFVSSAAVGYLQGHGRYAGLAAYRGAEVAIKTAFGLVAVELGAGAAGGLGGFLASDLFMFAVGCWLMRSDLTVRGGVRFPRELWSRTLGLGGVQGGIALASNLDTVLVAVVSHTPAASAGYQLASTLCRSPVFYSTSVSTVAFREMNAEPESAADSARKTLAMFVLPAMVLALAAATAPPWLVRLVSPGSFHDLSAFLPWTAITGLSLGLINLYATFFQARLTFRLPLVLLCTGSALLAAAIVLGAQVSQVRGLALATSAVVFLLAIAFASAAHRQVARHLDPGGAVTLVLAAVVVVAAAILARTSVAAWSAVVVAALLAALLKVRSAGRSSGHSDQRAHALTRATSSG